MPAHIRSLHTALTAEAEAARKRAMLVHPSNFKRIQSGSDAAMKAQELITRFDCLHKELMGQGIPDNEARTEVARIAAREVWDGFASQLRLHLSDGHQMDASVLAVALGSIQCMALPLARHPGDLVSATGAVSKARQRLRYNGGLMDRLHTQGNPAFSDADITLQSLEVFLAQPTSQAA